MKFILIGDQRPCCSCVRASVRGCGVTISGARRVPTIANCSSSRVSFGVGKGAESGGSGHAAVSPTARADRDAVLDQCVPNRIRARAGFDADLYQRQPTVVEVG